MSLDSSYLEYPKRHRGMDHDYYEWSNMFEREPVVWPGGKKVAVWIVTSLEWFPITPSDTPFRAPGHMVTAYPDYRHYTSREYGTRIGFYRLLDAFDKVGAKTSVAMNSAVAQRYPSIVKDIIAAGHEIIAHSTDMNGTISSGLSIEDEEALIMNSLDEIEKIAGGRPRGWLSIARSQSFNTPALLAKAGLEFMCDWCNDELPYRFHTQKGDIVNLPLNHELSDRQIINVQQHCVESYAQQIHDAYHWIEEEAQRFGGRMLPMHITPYIVGLPYRIAEFERLLSWLAQQGGGWYACGAEILAAVNQNRRMMG